MRQMDRDGKPIRVIVLKARQLGCSTMAQAYIFYRTMRPNTRCLTMAHDSDSTSNLFEMSRLFYDELPSVLKPKVKYSSTTMMRFENPTKYAAEKEADPGLRSENRVGTAGGKSMGRSKTRTGAHLSECAFPPWSGKLITGLAQSVPAKRGTFVIKESTANGTKGSEGEQFWLDWKAAVSGDSDYEPFFAPWWCSEEYELKPEASFRVGDRPDLYGDEQTEYDYLRNPQPLVVGRITWDKGFTHEQTIRKLAYRRYKIRNDMGKQGQNPLDQWDQEYPRNPHVAFIASGRPVFNNTKLQEQIEAIQANPPTTHNDTPTVRLQELFRDELVVYREPEVGMQYVIGADVAEGLEDRDFSHLKVLTPTGFECAKWHGTVDPDLFGEIIDQVGRSYNNALVAPEVNNMGASTRDKLKQLGYPNIYTQTVKEQQGEKTTKRLGWRTTEISKREMLSNLMAAHRDGTIQINDVETLEEMQSVVREPDGKVILNGKDRTVAVCIAVSIMSHVALEPHTTININPDDRPPRHALRSKEEYLRYLDRKRESGSEYFD